MSGKSFYDLDFIIEINEQRREQYISAYHRVLEKLTNIIFIYSAITVFLIPVWKEVFWSEKQHWLLQGCFILFLVLFVASVCYAVRLVIPSELAYLNDPSVVYKEYRLKYEQVLDESVKIEILLKASYIDELENAVKANIANFKRKAVFYHKALIFALWSALPYIVCLGFYFTNQESSRIPSE